MATRERHPQVIVIAGPNGAGKTSSAPALLREAIGIDNFVNADVIAQGLAGFTPQSVAVQAGRIMLARLDDLARIRADFAFESTLSGTSAARLLRRLNASGYHVHIFYLWLPSPDMAVLRVRGRVLAGGHDVPESAIRRRFWRGLVNFFRLYQPLAATWRLYDASVLDDRPLIAAGSADKPPVIIQSQLWADIQQSIEERR